MAKPSGSFLCCRRPALAALASWLLLGMGFSEVLAQPQRPIVWLTADKETFRWVAASAEGLPADTLMGRHDDLGMHANDRDALGRVLVDSGLLVRGEVISSSRLQLVFSMPNDKIAEVTFSSASDDLAISNLRWSTGEAVEQPDGEFWPGDVVLTDGSLMIGGEVGGSVLVIGGDVILREAAAVRGHVVVIGGILRQRGDAKIYGQVFAPGGHRRPRLTVSRAWEFEEGGFGWSPSVSYDRVDGLRLGAGARYQSSAHTPRFGLFAGYAMESKTWQYRLELRQQLLRVADLELHAAVFRLTETDDERWVYRTSNTIYALAAGSDYRDYFGVDGGEAGLRYKYRDRGVISLAYWNTDYRWLDAHPNLFHVFRPKHDFRDNFSTAPDEILSPLISRFEERTSALVIALALEPRESSEHTPRFDASFRIDIEIAGGALGGEFDYDRLQVEATGVWREGEIHRITTHFWAGNGRRDLPPNKLLFLGGIGTLPAYPQKAFVGDEALLASLEYRFTCWRGNTFDGGLILFTDVGRAAFEDEFWDFSEFKPDLGLGLVLGEGARLDLAKGLDHTDRDIRISVRLQQMW